jgi:hypothetical protein
LDWEGWGSSAPEDFDAATLYAYSLLQPSTAVRVRTVFPILGWPTRSGTGRRDFGTADLPHALPFSPTGPSAVCDAGISNMTQVLTGLIENGEFTQILQRLDD